MEIKNLFTPEAQKGFSTAYEGIKKRVKPLTDFGQQVGEDVSAKIAPELSKVGGALGNITQPIVKPIQQARQKSKVIGEVNSFFTDAGITMDDIKALAEDEGVDFNEVLTKFKNNGIKVQGMDEIVAKEQEVKKIQTEQPTDFSGRGLAINPEYDEVSALGNLTANIPKFQSEEDDSLITSIGKTIGNIPSNAVQVGAGVGDIGLSYLRNIDQGPFDALTETAKAKIINPTYQQALGVADIAKKGYEKGLETSYSWAEGGEAKKRGVFGGILGATDALTKKGTEFVVENPVATLGMVQGVKNVGRGAEALKTAGSEVMKGNIGKATAGLAKSTAIGAKEIIYDPVKMGVTAPIKLAGAITKKVLPNNISNKMAEQMLASQWKLTKPVRRELEGKIGQSGPKFALENDLIGKDIEATADNAGVFKIEKIKEKIDAVKKFGETETPSVAKNVAQVLKTDIEDSVRKSYGEGNTRAILEENHPELARVFNLADEIISSDKVDYVKLEQLKELHDYLNPENIQYDISGKPISETRNILSAGKRQKLQQMLEDEGNNRGIDIKKINRDIQGAYTLEKGLNDTVGRIANLNILGLGDTQMAVISSILGGAPGAVGGILLKKGLTSEGFVGGLAKKLYNKQKNVNPNNSNRSGASNPPVTRMGRIMNYNSDTPIAKITQDSKPIEQSNIPGSKKTRIEVPSNPKGNESKVLAKKQGVMVKGKEEQKLLPSGQRMRDKELANLAYDIASNTKAARYGGTGNTRAETSINGALARGQITRQEAIKIAEEILENKGGRFSYINKSDMEKYIDMLYSNKKIETFDDVLGGIPKKK